VEQVSLVDPQVIFKKEYLEMVDEFERAGEMRSEYERARQDFSTYVVWIHTQANGTELSPGIVPMNTLWLVREGVTILGEVHLRHHLTPALEVEGGHIGYLIRPLERRKSYGTLQLKLALEKARLLGLQRVLLTCDADNTGSFRIIEKNGGVMTGKAVSPYSGKPILRYWIELKV
jgi:predicted acetyltransferase